jgi:UDP-glucose 4-epimerase
MQILVLGSEGFIGSHTVKYFRSMGHTVTCADIVIKEEKDYLLINPEMPAFSGIFTYIPFDVCINATGAANVQFSFSHPDMDFMLNTVNVYHMLDSMRQYNPDCKFINFSSAAVYGNPLALPIKESEQIQPVSPYGYHKWYSEQVCKQLHTQFGLKTVSLRIFSAYGVGLKKQLFWDLYKKVSAAGDSVELFGTGKESRDFIYVDDIVQACSCIIDNAAFKGEAINVASGTETTIEDAVKKLLGHVGKDVSLKFMGNAKKGDPLNWRADISHLRSLGFESRIDIDAGMQKLAKWMKNLS